MKDLKQIYLEGFEEDGVSYAEYFCSKFSKNAVYVPTHYPVAAGYVIPKKLVDGNECVYFSAVATVKAERGKGYASELVRTMLKTAYKQGYSFAVLSPFNSEFYIKYGFFTVQRYKKVSTVTSCDVTASEVSENDIPIINSLYGKNALRLTFDEEYLSSLREEVAVYGGVPFKIVKGEKLIGFCVRESNNLSRVLFENKDEVFPINFADCKYKKSDENGEAFIQLRILSVTDFVKFLCPIKAFDCKIKISDGIINSNNGIFQIVSDGSELFCSQVLADKYDVLTDISDLAPYLSKNGYVKPLVTQFIDEY